jgi:hypothetical protein
MSIWSMSLRPPSPLAPHKEGGEGYLVLHVMYWHYLHGPSRMMMDFPIQVSYKRKMFIQWMEEVGSLLFQKIV